MSPHPPGGEGADASVISATMLPRFWVRKSASVRHCKRMLVRSGYNSETQESFQFCNAKGMVAL